MPKKSSKSFLALTFLFFEKNHKFTRQQPAEREARRRTSMSVIDRQISDWSDPRFEIGQMSQNGPFLEMEPLNMTLRNSILCGKRSQKWTKKGVHGRTDART